MYSLLMINNKHTLLENLIAQHGPALVRFLTNKLHSQEEAAEVAQETYLRLYKLDKIDQWSNAKAFLFQAASNMAVDQLRRKALHTKYLKSEEQKSQESSKSPEHIVNAQEQLQTIYQAIDELPTKIRQAFLLHRKSGLSYSEIANEMNISVSSVEKYILQALKHCRRSMAKEPKYQAEAYSKVRVSKTASVGVE
jgi:RNA polymerase sigma factor (sigma-70 family)